MHSPSLPRRKAAAVLSLILGVGVSSAALADAKGWLDWRGPFQTGVSPETGLPDKVEVGKGNNLWTIPIAGGGTPVISNGRLFALGYRGQGPDLQEVLLAADAETGKVLWEKPFNDYLSDITYDRYTIGSPAVDPQSGNVYAITSAGVFSCYTPDGKLVFQHPMMEEYGRLTFTNGRTGGPFIEDDLVIVRGITSNWGGEGAAQDRLYAFDKKTGGLVWSASPGAAPKDNSFARPYLMWHNGKRLMITGTGDGSLAAYNARTGECLWRYPISAGGMNSSVIVLNGVAYCIHADENLDASNAGRMTAVKIDAAPKPAPEGPPLLDKSAELWRNDDLAAISSSPVLVGNRLYLTDKTGHLDCIDPATGKVIWKQKFAPDQLHASPTYADGKLYVPFQNGSFFILRPKADGVETLSQVQLEGRCIGAPAIWNGKVYVFSTNKLYCFGKKGGRAGGQVTQNNIQPDRPKPGPTVALQIIPSEVALRPGEKAKFAIRGIDANGLPTQAFDAKQAKWEHYVPPTARVRSAMEGEFNASGELAVPKEAKVSAGAWQATLGGFKGTMRGRVLPALPYNEDFEGYNLTETQATEGAKFAYPPLPWIGARFKFEVRELDGNKVFAKTLDNIFFQRATVFLGNPTEKNYTFEADVRTDGNRRTRSNVGLINQRYLVTLMGNADTLEVTSNQERIRVSVPFKVEPKVWYRMKTRVDVASDGSGVVRAKVWKKGEAEPAAWTIEVPHKNAHKEGSPGLFGFSPQSLFRVYIDNIAITPNNGPARATAATR